MAHWQCIQNCGACCQLDPSDRPNLEDYLTPEELAHYLSLVGDDGWCINYDRDQRHCTIYADLDEFAIDCCEQQIAGVYGNQSEELDRFMAVVDLPPPP